MSSKEYLQTVTDVELAKMANLVNQYVESGIYPDDLRELAEIDKFQFGFPFSQAIDFTIKNIYREVASRFIRTQL